MRLLVLGGKGMRTGFVVADPLPFSCCLECGENLVSINDQRYGLHHTGGCIQNYTNRTSVHPGNTKASDAEASKTFITWLREPSSWETDEQAAARCAALGIV